MMDLETGFAVRCRLAKTSGRSIDHTFKRKRRTARRDLQREIQLNQQAIGDAFGYHEQMSKSLRSARQQVAAGGAQDYLLELEGLRESLRHAKPLNFRLRRNGDTGYIAVKALD